jgi:hypothetical protein
MAGKPVRSARLTPRSAAHDTLPSRPRRLPSVILPGERCPNARARTCHGTDELSPFDYDAYLLQGQLDFFRQCTYQQLKQGRVLSDIHLNKCAWTLPKPGVVKEGTIPQVTTTHNLPPFSPDYARALLGGLGRLPSMARIRVNDA